MRALTDWLALPPAQPGEPIDTVDTPALLLDLDVFEANVRRLQSWADQHGVAVRAHGKAHKCPAIALRQIDMGAIGICCQKVQEAAAFVQAGVRDVLIANEVVGPRKLALLAELTRQARMAVCIDHADQLSALSVAMRAAHTTVDVLVEIDVGQGRCGLSDIDAIVALARQAQAAEGIRLRGVQAYHGALQHRRAHAERAELAASVAQRVQDIVTTLREAGLSIEVISGAGTGSAEFDVRGPFTELQAGSYAFMDADYGANEWHTTLSFDTSLSLLTTVMSTAGGERWILDAGLKAMTTESGLPRVIGQPTLQVKAVNDEHTILSGTQPADPLRLGDRVQLVVPHVDPAFNLHDVVVATRAGRVEAVWPISARGPGR